MLARRAEVATQDSNPDAGSFPFDYSSDTRIPTSLNACSRVLES